MILLLIWPDMLNIRSQHLQSDCISQMSQLKKKRSPAYGGVMISQVYDGLLAPISADLFNQVVTTECVSWALEKDYNMANSECHLAVS